MNISKNILDKIILSNSIISFYFRILIDLYLLYYLYYDNSILLNLLFYFLFEYKILKNSYEFIFDYSELKYQAQYFITLSLVFNYYYYYTLFNLDVINELNIYQLVIGTIVNLIFSIFY